MKAAIGLGSNLGDRDRNIKEALDRLDSLNPKTKVLSISSLVETDPEGGPAGQGRYLNAAAIVETLLEPRALLAELLKIEAEMGRIRTPGERNTARIIDLDLLMVSRSHQKQSVIVAIGDELQIPHPRMVERLFVLRPLAEIAPDWVHPVLCKTIKELLAGLVI